jgi:hypothetical protein
MKRSDPQRLSTSNHKSNLESELVHAWSFSCAALPDHQQFLVSLPHLCRKRLRGVQMSTMAAVTCNKGALAFPQATALKSTSAKPAPKMLAMPCGSRVSLSISGSRGLPLLRREPRTKRRRDLTVVATAVPLSRQFTSVPGFTQIGEPVPKGVNLSSASTPVEPPKFASCYHTSLSSATEDPLGSTMAPFLYSSTSVPNPRSSGVYFILFFKPSAEAS